MFEIEGVSVGLKDGDEEGTWETLGVELGAMDTEGAAVMTALALLTSTKNGSVVAIRAAKPIARHTSLKDLDLEAACTGAFFFS